MSSRYYYSGCHGCGRNGSAFACRCGRFAAASSLAGSVFRSHPQQYQQHQQYQHFQTHHHAIAAWPAAMSTSFASFDQVQASTIQLHPLYQQQQQQHHYPGGSASSSSSSSSMRQSRGSSIFRHSPYPLPYRGREPGNLASPELRTWKNFPFASSARAAPVPHMDFRLACYNILAQCHLDTNLHLYSHVRHSDWLMWPRRQWNLLADIRSLSPDLLCLQEVEPEAYAAFFSPELGRLGYTGKFLAKTGKALDGCAIFWRSDLFQLDSYTPIEFFMPQLQCMAYHNVAQLAVLTCRSNSRAKLALANTHLLFNPNRGDAKLLQATTLLANIHARVKPGTPILLCGDLNSQPESALFRLFLDGLLPLDRLLISDVSMQNATSFSRRRSQAMIDPKMLGQAGLTYKCTFIDKAPDPSEESDAITLTHGLQLKSAYDYRNSSGLFTITSYTAHDVCTVDAIFYSAGRGDQLKCLSQLNLLTPRQMDDIGGIPNRLQSSDHLPLCAQFRWHFQETASEPACRL